MRRWVVKGLLGVVTVVTAMAIGTAPAWADCEHGGGGGYPGGGGGGYYSSQPESGYSGGGGGGYYSSQPESGYSGGGGYPGGNGGGYYSSQPESGYSGGGYSSGPQGYYVPYEGESTSCSEEGQASCSGSVDQGGSLTPQGTLTSGGQSVGSNGGSEQGCSEAWIGSGPASSSPPGCSLVSLPYTGQPAAPSGCQEVQDTFLGIPLIGQFSTVCPSGNGASVVGHPQSTPPKPNVTKLAKTVLDHALSKLVEPTLSTSPSGQGFVDFPELLGVQPVSSTKTSKGSGSVTVALELTPKSVTFDVQGDTYLGVTDQAQLTCPYEDAVEASSMTAADIDQLRGTSAMAFQNAQGGGKSACSPVPWYAFANMTGAPGEQGPAEASVQATIQYQATWTVTGAPEPQDLVSSVDGPAGTTSIAVGSAESILCSPSTASCQTEGSSSQ